MKKANTNSMNAFIPVSQKRVFSFEPPAYGILMKNIFMGECIISEFSKIVSLTQEQGEKVIKTNFG